MGDLSIVEEIDLIFDVSVGSEQRAVCGMGPEGFAHTARTHLLST